MLRRVVFGSTDSFEASLPSALIVGIRKESFVLYPLVVSPSGPGDQIIPVACGVQEDADYNYLVVVADLWDSSASAGQQYDLLVLRIVLSNHALEWAVRVSEPGSDERPADVIADQKDYLITGYTNRTGENRPFAIVISSDETVSSAYVYSALAGPDPVALYSCVREDGGHICVGEALDTIATFGISVGDEPAPSLPASVRAASGDPARSNRFVFFAESPGGARLDTAGNVDWAVQAHGHETADRTLETIVQLDDDRFLVVGTNPTRPASEPTQDDVRQAGAEVLTTTIAATTTEWDAGATHQDSTVTTDNEVNITLVPYRD